MSGAGDWGTDKARNRLQKDTPGQKVGEEKMEPFKLDGRTKAFKEKVKKLAYSKKKLNAQAIKLLDPKDFDNPLKGYPYNERMTKEHSEELMAFVKNANEAGVEPTELMDAVENWMTIKGYTHVKEDLDEEMSLDDIKKKYAKDIIAFQDDGKDLPNAAMKALYAYQGSDAIKTDDADEFDDFVMGLQMGKYKNESANESIKEGAFSVKLNKPYKRGDEKMYMDIIKKYGGKNLKYSPPKGRDPELDITFDGGNVKKMKTDLDKMGKGSWISD